MTHAARCQRLTSTARTRSIAREEQPVLPVRRFPWESTEYAKAFATLLWCADGRGAVRQLVRELVAAYSATSRAVDWGAGGGNLTRVLLEHFHCVYVIEPHPSMRTG